MWRFQEIPQPPRSILPQEWSQPVQLVPEDSVHMLAAWRPALNTMTFGQRGAHILNWVDKFEQWCTGQVSGQYGNCQDACQWLRQVVNHTAPGMEPGAQVDDYVRELRALAACRAAAACGPSIQELPADQISMLYPGSDIPPVPLDSLVQVCSVTHNARGAPLRSNAIGPGSTLLVRVPSHTQVHECALSFLAATAVETSNLGDGKIVVTWHLPGRSSQQNFRGGKKKQVVDIFGAWAPLDAVSLQELSHAIVPDPLVNLEDVLECNFEWTKEDTLPYDIFDALRLQHGIDVTGLNSSLTHGGNLYRSYALMRGMAGTRG